MKEIIDQLKDIMIEAAERDGNHELSERLRVLRKREIEEEKKDKVVCVDGKTYRPYKIVVFRKDKVYLKDGKCKIISNIKRINVADYKNIVIIDGKLFKEIKKKGGE